MSFLFQFSKPLDVAFKLKQTMDNACFETNAGLLQVWQTYFWNICLSSNQTQRSHRQVWGGLIVSFSSSLRVTVLWNLKKQKKKKRKKSSHLYTSCPNILELFRDSGGVRVCRPVQFIFSSGDQLLVHTKDVTDLNPNTHPHTIPKGTAFLKMESSTL